MLVLPIAQPMPAMRQPQIQPQLVEGGIGLSQTLLPGGATLTLGVEQSFLEVQGGIQQPLRQGAPI